MLLTRSLPPQFLLPAWSVRQLAQASQRAPAPFSTYEGRPPKPRRRSGHSFRKIDFKSHTFRQVVADELDLKPEPRAPGEPDKQYVFHRTAAIDGHIKPKQTAPEQQEAHKSEPLSLFDELFPEESQARSKRQKAAEKRLDKLPAFKWNSTSSAPNVKDRREREREERRVKQTTIPQRPDPVQEEETQHTPNRPNKLDLQRLRNDLGRESEPATLPSLLSLNGCSTNLEESDFFRLGPRGEHIEGWTSGIIKVIPARDRDTLEKLGHYYILCSNDAAARAYQDRTNKLLRLAKSWKIMKDSGVPIPPGYLEKGEDPVKLLQGFSLVPAHGTVSMRILRKPYKPSVIRLLKEGGDAARITKESKAGEMVIFSVDIGHITQDELMEALKDDGRRRNLHWRLGREEESHIVKLTYDHSLEEPGEGIEDPVKAYRARKKEEYRRPSRYVISFRDRNEARRFVREWHRRPFPLKRKHNPGDEPIPIVNAEILW